MEISECNKPVAENIARAIKESGLKQVYVANKAGYTPQMFSDMIAGRRIIKVNDILRISEALGVDANYLFRIEKGE